MRIRKEQQHGWGLRVPPFVFLKAYIMKDRHLVGQILHAVLGLLTLFALLFFALKPEIREGELVWFPVPLPNLLLVLMMFSYYWLPRGVRGRMTLAYFAIFIALWVF